MRRSILIAAAALATLAVAGAALATLGDVREFRIPPPGGRPNAITLGPDSAVWFTELSPPAIGRRGMNGFASFRLPNPAVPFSIVAGSDGALWFTESSGRGIGRITTSGAITELDVPACSGCGYPHGPLGLAAGSDGALWYTRPGKGTIGRVTTDGRITEIPVPGPERDATWITTGPDGALWFTDDTGIGRLSMDGSFSQVWSGLNYPTSITTGPDGNLWVTGGAQDVVARVTPAGRGRLFALDLNCDPQWIAPGAGALWITCYNLDEIERVTTAGAVTRIPVPGHIQNYPDVLSGIVRWGGAMWFAEYATNRIGRVTTG